MSLDKIQIVFQSREPSSQRRLNQPRRQPSRSLVEKKKEQQEKKEEEEEKEEKGKRKKSLENTEIDSTKARYTREGGGDRFALVTRRC